MRLLYVDDDRINTLLFVETCKLAGSLEVNSAATGAEALDLVQTWRPDVLVIDLHLPDTDGYALLAALRSDAALAGVPAFLCSAEAASAVREPAQRAGFDGCWPKPVDLDRVLADLAIIRDQKSPAARPDALPT
jgi:two-component system, OmpR family, response regulator